MVLFLRGGSVMTVWRAATTRQDLGRACQGGQGESGWECDGIQRATQWPGVRPLEEGSA